MEESTMKNIGLLLAFLCLFGSCKRIELYDYNRLVRLDLCVDMSLEVMPDTSLFSKDADFDYWWQGGRFRASPGLFPGFS